MSIITTSSHGPGRTCLAFSQDGSIVYTGGSDCVVRIWRTTLGATQEPDAASEADGAITSLASATDCWLSGSADAEVRQYYKHKPDFIGLVTNTLGLPVECISIDPTGMKAAVTSQDLIVRLVELRGTHSISLLEGHTKGVRRASWHPSGSILTTCGSDGKIMVWDVSNDEHKLEKVIDGIIPAVAEDESEYAHDCSVLWHPSGNCFYVASRMQEIVAISRETWSKSSTLVDDSVSGVITALALSMNGAHLATSIDSTIFIWSTHLKQLLFRQPCGPKATVTHLAFSPAQNLLAWTDSDGNFSRWQKPIPDNLADHYQLASSSKAAGNYPTNTDLSAPADVDAQLANVEMADLDDDWIIDDTDGQMIDDDPSASQKGEMVKEMVSITRAQPPFQPACTPMENKKRYLAYNAIGVIEVTDQDAYHIVNVEFHDQSARKGYHFNDYFKYNAGYLGERGAIFACEPESDHPAQAFYKPHGKWKSHGEWTYRMRKGEKILGVAASGIPPAQYLHESFADSRGSGSVVIATSEGDLTFLSETGRERRIMGLGAEYVSMIAGYEWVFVVHRAGSTTIDGSQNLSFSIIDSESFSLRQTGLLPLPKGHTLKWIGLTSEGAPATYDTAGYVHILTNLGTPMCATWARVMDTDLLERREGKEESYWPIAISGSTFMCLILKGKQQHPNFPRPLVQEFPIRLPLRCDADDMVLEEAVERELLLLEFQHYDISDETGDIAKRELSVDKELIKLIQIACKKDNIPRAIELTKLLHHIASLDMAVKVADFYHLIGLREKIETLKEVREGNSGSVAIQERKGQWTKPSLLPHDPASDYVTSVDPLVQLSVTSGASLARAMPFMETSSHSRNMSETVSVTSSTAPYSIIGTSAKQKRKWVEGSSSEQMTSLESSAPRLACVNPFAKKLEPLRKSQPYEIAQSIVDREGIAESPVKNSFSSIKNETGKKEAIKQATLSKHMFSSTSDKPNPTKKKKLMGSSGIAENLPEAQK